MEKREDDRGFFARLFCEKEFSTKGLEIRWLQMNTSLTKQSRSIRGLHFQYPPKAELKLVRCLRGAIWDVIVDIRSGSPTYGHWDGIELNDQNRSMIFVPKGFCGSDTLKSQMQTF